MPSAADPGMLMTPVPLWMSNCDDPGSGSDQRTVPGSAQCREPPVQVRADEPDSADAGAKNTLGVRGRQGPRPPLSSLARLTLFVTPVRAAAPPDARGFFISPD